MAEDNADDSVNIRIPAKFVIGILAVGFGIGGGATAYLGPTINAKLVTELQNRVRAVEARADKSDTRSTAALEAAVRAEALGKAALDLGTQNAKQINNNRDFIVERTFDRFTKEDNLEQTRRQIGRDMQQDRRVDGLERDIDTLRKED